MNDDPGVERRLPDGSGLALVTGAGAAYAGNPIRVAHARVWSTRLSENEEKEA